MRLILGECHHRLCQYLACLLACVAGINIKKSVPCTCNQFPPQGCGSLSMKGLTVPGQLILGSGASLGCDYNLEGSKLYSVKWYKDGQEFFRFMPSMDNKIEVFSVRGVHVEVRRDIL